PQAISFFSQRALVLQPASAPSSAQRSQQPQPPPSWQGLSPLAASSPLSRFQSTQRAECSATPAQQVILLGFARLPWLHLRHRLAIVKCVLVCVVPVIGHVHVVALEILGPMRRKFVHLERTLAGELDDLRAHASSFIQR